MPGPLDGYRVIELGGIGPGPFTGMILADLGADVLRIERPSTSSRGRPFQATSRGKQSAEIDLRHPHGRDLVLELVDDADALIEGFRPGVAERLGLGPDDCMERNRGLIYGRMTGFGQTGPLAHSSGHDINYIALSGSLSMIGRAGEPPVPPVNLLGDFGGGGMLLALGIVAALVERSRSSQGQIVDAAMVDGAALLAASLYPNLGTGVWGPRGTNVLDTGAWYYEVYETADGGYVSFGSLEEQFYEEMLELTGLAADVDGGGPVPDRLDRSTWPEMKRRMAALVKTRTRDEWCKILEGSDACFAPVLDPKEAHLHPHNALRGTFIHVDGVLQPAPAPRFSRTPAPTPAPEVPETDRALGHWGVLPDRLAELRALHAIA